MNKIVALLSLPSHLRSLRILLVFQEMSTWAFFLASRSLKPLAWTGHSLSGLSGPPARCRAALHCSSSTSWGFTRAAGLSTTFRNSTLKRYLGLAGL